MPCGGGARPPKMYKDKTMKNEATETKLIPRKPSPIRSAHSVNGAPAAAYAFYILCHAFMCSRFFFAFRGREKKTRKINYAHNNFGEHSHFKMRSSFANSTTNTRMKRGQRQECTRGAILYLITILLIVLVDIQRQQRKYMDASIAYSPRIGTLAHSHFHLVKHK